LAAVLHINKSNAAGNSKKVVHPWFRHFWERGGLKLAAIIMLLLLLNSVNTGLLHYSALTGPQMHWQCIVGLVALWWRV